MASRVQYVKRQIENHTSLAHILVPMPEADFKLLGADSVNYWFIAVNRIPNQVNAYLLACYRCNSNGEGVGDTPIYALTLHHSPLPQFWSFTQGVVESGLCQFVRV